MLIQREQEMEERERALREKEVMLEKLKNMESLKFSKHLFNVFRLHSDTTMPIDVITNLYFEV